MDQDKANRAIAARWITQWQERSAAWVTLYPTLVSSGQLFVPYALDNNKVREGITTATMKIRSLDSQQYTMGPEGKRKWERLGFIDVRITGPRDVGRRPFDLLGIVVRKIFEGKRFAFSGREAGVTTHETSVRELPNDKEAAQLWVVSAITPFEYLEVS